SRWPDLIGILNRMVEASSSPAEKVRLLHRIAGLWVERFGNVNQAIRPLEQLVAIDPSDETARKELRDYYTRRRSWRSLYELERTTVPASGPERRKRLGELGQLVADRLGDLGEAIVVWNQVLAENQNDSEALVQLAVLYDREKRWPA